MIIHNEVTLRRASLVDAAALRQIKPFTYQRKYSGEGADLIEYLEAKNKAVYLIYYGERPAGCFYLEFNEISLQQYAAKPYAVLLALTIDQNYQDKKIGKQAMLQLIKVFPVICPELEELILTVNCENKSAQALYKKVGFIDSGKLYHEGKAGPEHVYICRR